MKELEVEVHIGYGNCDDYYKDIVLIPNAFEKWNTEKQLAWLKKISRNSKMKLNRILPFRLIQKRS